MVFMGGDSCSKGRGLGSQHSILDGNFSNFFVVKIVMFVRKDENKLKRGPIIKIMEAYNSEVFEPAMPSALNRPQSVS